MLGAPEAITAPSEWNGLPSLSRDGKRILYATSESRANLERAALDPVASRRARRRRSPRARAASAPATPRRTASGWPSTPRSRRRTCSSSTPTARGLRQLTADAFRDRYPALDAGRLAPDLPVRPRRPLRDLEPPRRWQRPGAGQSRRRQRADLSGRGRRTAAGSPPSRWPRTARCCSISRLPWSSAMPCPSLRSRRTARSSPRSPGRPTGAGWRARPSGGRCSLPGIVLYSLAAKTYTRISARGADPALDAGRPDAARPRLPEEARSPNDQCESQARPSSSFSRMPPWVESIRNSLPPSSDAFHPMPAFWLHPKRFPDGSFASC